MTQKFYALITYLLWPILFILPSIRLQKNKEIEGRTKERFGIPTKFKTEDKLIWFHAASNGEALSAIPLIQTMHDLPSSPNILITTMTVTAADLIQKRLGDNPRIIHQFIPYDFIPWINKFHKFWKPDMAIWIESELWPNHLNILKKNNIPAVLVNARLSDKSVRRWSIFQSWFQKMMSCFDIILVQTNRDLKNIQSLNIPNIKQVGNLKDLAPALPFDIIAADDVRGVIEQRNCILYASTHDPEEEMVFDIHKKLKSKYPDLLSVIIPRHPKRGEKIANHLNRDGLNIARRSLKMSPRINTDIYVADTLGEMGVFYHLCPIVFVGNSINTNQGGGHNLLEPAWFDCAILSGDDLHNFSTQADEMPKSDACIIVKDEQGLEKELEKLLNDNDRQKILSDNAYKYVSQKHVVGIEKILFEIEPTCKKAKLL